MSAKKYCNNCGGELVGGARFCRFCGHPVSPDAASRPKSEAPRKPITPPPSQRESPQTPPPPRKRLGFQIRQPESNAAPPRITPPAPPNPPHSCNSRN
ncbi:MAG: hypothetical protein ACFFBD_21755 [Candidatus Hodarchaeota archaeon]